MSYHLNERPYPSSTNEKNIQWMSQQQEMRNGERIKMPIFLLFDGDAK